MDRHDYYQCRREIAALKKKVENQDAEIVAIRIHKAKLQIENSELKKQAQRLKKIEEEHTSTLGVVEGLRKQLATKTEKLASTSSKLMLIKQARRKADEERERLAKANDALSERVLALGQQASDLKRQLTKARSDHATLFRDKEAIKLQLKASEDQLTEALMTSVGLQFSLDAKNAEIEEQRRLAEILREQFPPLGGNDDKEAARKKKSDMLAAISSDFSSLLDSMNHAFAEKQKANAADDSGIGSDIVETSPDVETDATVEPLDYAVANGSVDALGIANDGDVSSTNTEASSVRATTENCPVLSRLLQQPPRPLKTSVKRPNVVHGAYLVDDNPAKQARVELETDQ